MKQSLLLLATVGTLLVIGGVSYGYNQHQPVAKQAVITFNKSAHSTDDPNSVWVVANKQRALEPKDYIPSDLVAPAIPLRLSAYNPEMQLRSEAAKALEAMTAAAKKNGINLMIASAYRSYATQITVYGNEVKNNRQAAADSQSARPGHSEHQTGLAVDLEPTNRTCEIQDCFAETAEGKWLSLNAGDYGFMQRYTAAKVAITGYRAESWHYRYVGVALTTELKKQNQTTLEEFFGLPAAPDYQI